MSDVEACKNEMDFLGAPKLPKSDVMLVQKSLHHSQNVCADTRSHDTFKLPYCVLQSEQVWDGSKADTQ